MLWPRFHGKATITRDQLHARAILFYHVSKLSYVPDILNNSLGHMTVDLIIDVIDARYVNSFCTK